MSVFISALGLLCIVFKKQLITDALNFITTGFYITRNGAMVYVIGEHRFHKDKRSGGKMWRCARRCSVGCKAVAVIIDGNVVAVKNNHNH